MTLKRAYNLTKNWKGGRYLEKRYSPTYTNNVFFYEYKNRIQFTSDGVENGLIIHKLSKKRFDKKYLDYDEKRGDITRKKFKDNLNLINKNIDVYVFKNNDILFASDSKLDNNISFEGSFYITSQGIIQEQEYLLAKNMIDNQETVRKRDLFIGYKYRSISNEEYIYLGRLFFISRDGRKFSFDEEDYVFNIRLSKLIKKDSVRFIEILGRNNQKYLASTKSFFGARKLNHIYFKNDNDIVNIDLT